MPEALRAAAEAAFSAALRLAAAGQAKAAREQLLLGQRFMAAAGVAPGGADGQEPDSEYDDPRAEMERRLLRLLDVEVKRQRRAIGLDQLSDQVDVDRLNISIFFADDHDNPRRATPAELARMEAGDWPLYPRSGG